MTTMALGLMLDQWQGNSNFTNNIFVTNVSQNDGRKNNYGGICVFGQVSNSLIYNNVVLSQRRQWCGHPREVLPPSAGRTVTGLKFANNIIQTSGVGQLLNVASNELHGTNIQFVGNTWYASGSTPNYYFGKTYTSLSSWQAGSGQKS
jgi:hypothetical protein